MPLIAIALMGVFLLPGSGATPVVTTPSIQASSIASADDEPSPKKVATAHAVVTPSYTVGMTSYNAVPEQTDGNPFVTASGAHSNPEVVAARSRDLAEELPFGTVIRIERSASDTPNCGYSKVDHLIGYRVIADTMNARFTKKVDVLFDQTDTVAVNGKQMNPSYALGYCTAVTVSVVGHVDPNHIPSTQAELAAMFDTTELAMNI